ncbi:MAG: DUF4190 domain-containing protein [Phycisphaerales bacterium]|nr:MAG: DUF4190 domain-containing protein [Phycisphaerales bacterium]
MAEPGDTIGPALEPIDADPYELESGEPESYAVASVDDGGFFPVGDAGPVGTARPCVLDGDDSALGDGRTTQIVPAAPVAIVPPPLPTLAGHSGHTAHAGSPGQLAAAPALGGPMVMAPPRDVCSVASAICGLTGFIPFISQAAGLALGIAGLVRINRARRRGVAMRGTGWAVTGLSTSLFGLLCWLGVLGGMFFLRSTIQQATSGIDVLNIPVK